VSTGPIASAVAEGRLPGRVWFYSTYACNLACTYCLTESAPGAPRRALAGETMVELAAQAAELGFTDLGVTGGEPFLSPNPPIGRGQPTRRPGTRSRWTMRAHGGLKASSGR